MAKVPTEKLAQRRRRAQTIIWSAVGVVVLINLLAVAWLVLK